LDTGGATVGGTQNDITFDSSNVLVAALPDGSPDCTLNPDLKDKDQLFIFRPNGCTGAICRMLRTAVFRTFPPISPIPDGAMLYTCRVNISATAEPGEYALAVSRVQLTNPLGTPVAGVVGIDGTIVVVPRPTATPTPTASPTPADTDTPTVTQTPSQTATPSNTPIACVGDCNHSSEVTIEEIISMVNIALGNSAVSACLAGDANSDGEIDVTEIIAAVNSALNGCPQSRPAS
jgi:hypothetical protein